MNTGRKIAAGLCFIGLLAGTIVMKAYAKEPIVIVIDPGHGGENLGAEYEQYTEKEMTMIVATAMKEELEKYEDVIVYLTRETDTDMSLAQRAEFAKEKNADFLFCLHFNMSVSHELFGAEVWVPAFDSFYTRGYGFAEIEMEMLTELGLYSRGIKTKLNDRGDNYYGILRQCSNRNVASALIEHCHLDQENDKPFYQQGKEQLQEFGKLDATAAAKYFQLKSDLLGVDYSDYPVPEVELPKGVVAPDKTEPEVCSIELLSLDEETGEAKLTMKASDSDSYILYYNYSIDGGNTYSPLEPWPRPVWNRSEPENTFTVPLPFDREIQLRTTAYNGFDGFLESNIIEIPAIASKEEELLGEAGDDRYEEIVATLEGDAEAEEDRKENAYLTVILILLLCSFMVCITFAMVKMIFKIKRGNKRRR